MDMRGIPNSLGVCQLFSQQSHKGPSVRHEDESQNKGGVETVGDRCMTRADVERYQAESVKRAMLPPVAKHSQQQQKTKQTAGEAA